MKGCGYDENPSKQIGSGFRWSECIFPNGYPMLNIIPAYICVKRIRQQTGAGHERRSDFAAPGFFGDCVR